MATRRDEEMKWCLAREDYLVCSPPNNFAATDEDDEKAHAFYRHTYPPCYGGQASRGSSMSWGFMLVASTIFTHREGAKKLRILKKATIGYEHRRATRRCRPLVLRKLALS